MTSPLQKILDGSMAAESSTGPPLPPEKNPYSPAPCPTCGNPLFWSDAYDTVRCGECQPPPAPDHPLVRGWRMVIVDHRGKFRLVPWVFRRFRAAGVRGRN